MSVAKQPATLRFMGPDGIEHVSLIVAENPKFAAACLKTWEAETGKAKSWLAQHNAISLPAATVERTRARLAAMPDGQP